MDTALLRYVKENNLGKGIKLSIGLDKLANVNHPQGKQSRYLRCFINGAEVTGMVASLCNFPISKARDTYGCLIVHGCGMDMGWFVQSEVYSRAFQNGEKEMFDMGYYHFLGRRKRNGKYPYDSEKE